MSRSGLESKRFQKFDYTKYATDVICQRKEVTIYKYLRRQRVLFHTTKALWIQSGDVSTTRGLAVGCTAHYPESVVNL